ncbi:MAG: DUF4835 family protein [Paludibacteraceae bacterium]|nr:DUF4835 family protein [Paludibacteraceae bacterium]
MISNFRFIAIFLVSLIGIASLRAQEINCTVTVNSDQIEGSNKQVYETLKSAIEEYMNQNRWTNMTFAEQEKIECSMMLVVKAVADNMYSCEMTLQSRRPVYGTTYTTPLLNFVDRNFNFTYQEFDRIEYQQNQFTTNLTAMLAYYCYLIIGHDMDSYQRLGGTPFFEQCENIVNACQSASMDNSEQKGWLAFDSNRNRYALINNLLDEAFKKYRNYYYEYHRLGLDEMSGNVTNGRARIAEGISVLKEAYRARPATYVINTFLDAKADELVDIFKKGTDKEKKEVYDLLVDIDPTRQGTYDRMNEN